MSAEQYVLAEGRDVLKAIPDSDRKLIETYMTVEVNRRYNTRMLLSKLGQSAVITIIASLVVAAVILAVHTSNINHANNDLLEQARSEYQIKLDAERASMKDMHRGVVQQKNERIADLESQVESLSYRNDRLRTECIDKVVCYTNAPEQAPAPTPPEAVAPAD